MQGGRHCYIAIPSQRRKHHNASMTITCRDSPNSSRPNSTLSHHPSYHPSPTTSTNITAEAFLERKISRSSRPSILSRLRSSISAGDRSPTSGKRPPIHPSDFKTPPEQPEKHFIDSIGMCTHPLAHFVTHWRLCQPIEYTTSLADHGITYADHTMLLAALEDFLDELPKENHYHWHEKKNHQHGSSVKEQPSPRHTSITQLLDPPSYTVTESAQQYKIAEQQARSLNRLLENISWNWQMRGLPIMVCIASYSLFTPNRISEALVQVLHVPRPCDFSPSPSTPSSAARGTNPYLFIDPFDVAQTEEHSVAVSRQKANRGSTSPVSPTSFPSIPHYHHHHQLRDRTRPWPLWPNAIPSQKRELMNVNVDRYGVDPYFRAWMRDNINSRTRSTSFSKYMIEQEDNPFINKRLQYVNPPSRKTLAWHSLTPKPRDRHQQHSGKVNRDAYEHNRRLEVRKAIEHGSRLRIVRFGFRHPLYPPHTPEMEELGLSKRAYQTIICNIEDIRKNTQKDAEKCMPHLLASWHKIRHRSTEDALAKVSEFVRKVNKADRRIVWTIEKIPGVYDRGLGRDKKEWEISAWNGEDPLELLIQLEKWGIIEETLNIDDEE
ncbi:hypothetical protein CC80DRAFT_521880 [Byssothecium circinans]|uniref:Uncharacterized protein n=1 Tax=Byssothecium circinans TaxID=147558 RepID=A0A6A5UCS1_9PLEO|nr:hypothetical protein CC80DRAFT_521880 [Byssothecium circinans]